MVTTVDIKGEIIPNDYQWVYDWLEWDATSPKKVDKAIQEANGDDLEVIINSGGGDVYAGSEIYTKLKDYKGNVTVKIVGIAASAASIIAMAGKKVKISPTAQIMIHNVMSASAGDYRDHAHESEVLKNWNKSIASAYRLKTGLSEEELLNLMNRETWLTAKEALEKGFVDEIMFDDENKLNLVATSSQILPRQVVNKIRNELLKKKGEMKNMDESQQANLKNNESISGVQPQDVKSPSNIATKDPKNEDATVKERERLKAIDEIAANIDPELVNEAKYGSNPMTAEELAFKALKEGKIINSAIFEQAVQANKASGVDGVQAQTIQQKEEKEYDLTNLKDVNEIFNQFAAASQIGRPQNIRRG